MDGGGVGGGMVWARKRAKTVEIFAQSWKSEGLGSDLSFLADGHGLFAFPLAEVVQFCAA